jgi:hypothetical protein
MPGVFSRAATSSAGPLSLYRNGIRRKARLIAYPDRGGKKRKRTREKCEKMKAHCGDRGWKKEVNKE